MRTVPKFLALTTARAGLATQVMGAFVKVKLADKCHDKGKNLPVNFYDAPLKNRDS